MGFNKRYLTFTAVLNQFSESGVEGVIKYVTKPDSLILQGNDELLNEIVELCKQGERKQLQKVLTSYIYNK